MKKRYKYVSAISGAAALKGLVVSAGRARWKERHDEPKERTIRLLRFIWMRKGTLLFDDRHKFHSYVLGALLRQGLVAWQREADKQIHLVVTRDAYAAYLKE
jgi:hypothetical protein